MCLPAFLKALCQLEWEAFGRLIGIATAARDDHQWQRAKLPGSMHLIGTLSEVYTFRVGRSIAGMLKVSRPA